MAGEEAGEGWWQVREARGGMVAGEGRKGRDVMATGEGGKGRDVVADGGVCRWTTTCDTSFNTH